MTFLKEKSVDLTDVKVRIWTCYCIWCYIFPIKTNSSLFILFDQQTIDGNIFLYSKPFLWWGLCPIISLIGWSWLSNWWLANDQYIHGFKFNSGKNGQIIQMREISGLSSIHYKNHHKNGMGIPWVGTVVHISCLYGQANGSVWSLYISSAGRWPTNLIIFFRWFSGKSNRWGWLFSEQTWYLHHFWKQPIWARLGWSNKWSDNE